MQRVRREMAEWLLRPMLVELALHRLERSGAPEEGEELLAAALADELADALHDDEVPGDRRHHDEHAEQHACDGVGILEEMAEAQG
jgi:hypothetical protein